MTRKTDLDGIWTESRARRELWPTAGEEDRAVSALARDVLRALSEDPEAVEVEVVGGEVAYTIHDDGDDVA